MTTTTRQPVSTWIRRIDDVEWPVAGSWEIRRGGSLAVDRATRLTTRRASSAIVGGTLAVAGRGLGSVLDLHLDGAADGLGELRISAEVVAADAGGTWHVDGGALVRGTWEPLGGTVGYCGVYRTGWRPTAWLELALTVRPAGRRAPRLELTGQVDAFAPDAADADQR